MTPNLFDGRASAPGPPGESMPVGARPSESRRGCRDLRCPMCNPIVAASPTPPPLRGTPPEPSGGAGPELGNARQRARGLTDHQPDTSSSTSTDDFARAAAETVAEILRKALDPPLTVEQRLDALELEIERQRVELQRVGESHAHSLEGA